MTRDIKPVAPEDWPDGLANLSTGSEKPLNIYAVLANYPELLESWIPFRQHIVRKNSLEPRHQEMLILRVAINTKSEYEWKHHVYRGKKAGLTDADIERVKTGCSADGMTESEKVLLQAVDELDAEYMISESTWAELSKYFSKKQVLDILSTVGMYTTLAYIAKSCDVEVDHWLDE